MVWKIQLHLAIPLTGGASFDCDLWRGDKLFGVWHLTGSLNIGLQKSLKCWWCLMLAAIIGVVVDAGWIWEPGQVLVCATQKIIS